MGGLWVVSEDGGLWGEERVLYVTLGIEYWNRILESNIGVEFWNPNLISTLGGDPIFDGLGGRAWEPRGWGAEPFFVLCCVMVWCVAVGVGSKKLIHLFCCLFLESTQYNQPYYTTMLSLFRQSSPAFEDVFAPVAQGSESPEAVPVKRRAYDPVKRREQYQRSLERKQAAAGVAAEVVAPEVGGGAVAPEVGGGAVAPEVGGGAVVPEVAAHDDPLERKKAYRRSYSKRYYAAKKEEKLRLREELALLQRGREESAGETTDGLDSKRSIPLPSQTIQKIFAVTTDGQMLCLFERS